MVIEQLIGQIVKVNFRGNCRGAVQGTLKECDEYFVGVDQGDDKPNAFVPLTAILLIEPVQEK